jgi:hypothetical protein
MSAPVLGPDGRPVVATLDRELESLMRHLETYDVAADGDSQFRYAFTVITALASRLPPLVTIQALLMGACFFADNHQVSREKLIDVFRQFHLPAGATLEFKTGGAS